MKAENWKQRRRAGLVMSWKQMSLLRALRDAADAGAPAVYLDGLHQRTLKSLLRHGWVFRSVDRRGLDRDRYAITDKGRRALKIFERPAKRLDGVCPACGVNPKLVYPSGQYGYCKDCDREHKRRQRALKRPRLNPNRPCSDCGGGPLYVTSTGEVKTWCAACRKKRRAADRQRRRERLLARIATGDIPLCKCGEPLYVTPGGWVVDKCESCHKAYMARYNARRRGHAEPTAAR